MYKFSRPADLATGICAALSYTAWRPLNIQI